ncbi:MAG: hypothetical protein QM661_12195 [Solimonas sp.]
MPNQRRSWIAVRHGQSGFGGQQRPERERGAAEPPMLRIGQEVLERRRRHPPFLGGAA